MSETKDNTEELSGYWQEEVNAINPYGEMDTDEEGVNDSSDTFVYAQEPHAAPQEGDEDPIKLDIQTAASNFSGGAFRCAEFVRRLLSTAGLNVSGDAWTMGKSALDQGAELVYDAAEATQFGSAQEYGRYMQSLPQDANSFQGLKEGDLVELYNKNSRYNDRAFNEGTGDTHVGVITGIGKDGIPLISEATTVKGKDGKNRGLVREIPLTQMLKSGSMKVARVYAFNKGNRASMEDYMANRNRGEQGGGQMPEQYQLNETYEDWNKYFAGTSINEDNAKAFMRDALASIGASEYHPKNTPEAALGVQKAQEDRRNIAQFVTEAMNIFKATEI